MWLSLCLFSPSPSHPRRQVHTLFIRSKEEPKVKASIRQVQTFAPALPSPVPTPYHSEGEGNRCLWPEPRLSPKSHLLEVIMVYQHRDHYAGQKVKVTFKPCVSLTNLFPTLSLHGPLYRR